VGIGFGVGRSRVFREFWVADSAGSMGLLFAWGYWDLGFGVEGVTGVSAGRHCLASESKSRTAVCDRCDKVRLRGLGFVRCWWMVRRRR
jgi:hypothetical protein